MSKNEQLEIKSKVEKAARLLLMKRQRQPGVKGWELKKNLGPKYLEVIKLLKKQLEDIGLSIKIIPQEESGTNGKEAMYNKAKFYVVFKEHPTLSEVKTAGWRIDDLAMLSATLLQIISHQGRVERKEVEEMLYSKFLKWRVDYNLNRFIKMGYLREDEKGLLYIDWRTKAEIDSETLMSLLLAKPSLKEKS